MRLRRFPATVGVFNTFGVDALLDELLDALRSAAAEAA